MDGFKACGAGAEHPLPASRADLSLVVWVLVPPALFWTFCDLPLSPDTLFLGGFVPKRLIPPAESQDPASSMDPRRLSGQFAARASF